MLTVDPGPHVGVAYWEQEGSQPEWFRSWEETPETLYQNAEDWIKTVDVLVCEAFIIGGSRKKSSNETIEQIGVLRYLAKKHDTPFVEQQPGAGTRFAGKGWSTLKQIGWHRPGPDHANSAAGHLLIYLCENQLIDRRRLLTPAPTGS